MLFDDPVINIRLAIDYKRSQCLECYMRAIARSKQKKVGVKKKKKKSSSKPETEVKNSFL